MSDSSPSKQKKEVSTTSCIYCLGFLACVTFALLVAAAITLGVDGASVGVILAVALVALLMLLLTGCLCCWLPSKERVGRAYDK